MTTAENNSVQLSKFERSRDTFLKSKNLDEFCCGIVKMYTEGEIFRLAFNLHPIQSWPSAQLELQYLSNFFDMRSQFRAFLLTPCTNKAFAEKFLTKEIYVSLFLYRLEKIGLLSSQKIGRFKSYLWKSNEINEQALLHEYGTLLNFSPRDNSIWDSRIKAARAKHSDVDPGIEHHARNLFAEMLTACARGEAPRDAKDRLLDSFSGELKSKIDIRIWQLQVQYLGGV